MRIIHILSSKAVSLSLSFLLVLYKMSLVGETREGRRDAAPRARSRALAAATRRYAVRPSLLHPSVSHTITCERSSRLLP